jgi:hypothetical protein
MTITKEDFYKSMENMNYTKVYAQRLYTRMKNGYDIFSKWESNHFSIEVNDKIQDVAAKGSFKLSYDKLNDNIDVIENNTEYYNPETETMEYWNTDAGGYWDDIQDVVSIGYYE